jgi:hypothetical protein
MSLKPLSTEEKIHLTLFACYFFTYGQHRSEILETLGKENIPNRITVLSLGDFISWLEKRNFNELHELNNRYTEVISLILNLSNKGLLILAGSNHNSSPPSFKSIYML